jgi:hypothetical protein
MNIYEAWPGIQFPNLRRIDRSIVLKKKKRGRTFCTWWQPTNFVEKTEELCKELIWKRSFLRVFNVKEKTTIFNTSWGGNNGRTQNQLI